MIERATRTGIFLLALAPFGLLAFDTLTDRLGTNPIETVTHRTGWWALTFLLLTLAVTPVRQLTGIGWLVKLRRMLGLYAFFYASLHFGVYIGLDQFFAFDYIVEDIMDRPYITVGFTALVILTPLALTSTKRMVRRLGGRRWNRLHKMVYVAAVLGVLHFLWLVKADILEPAIFALTLGLLLSYRLVTSGLRQLRLRRAARSAARPASLRAQSPAAEGSAGA
ncbi:MAG: sulfoxide reductase heme-binding subunit YedZ [Gemmatimonadota bacterium]|nr:MAG: sulfoxide reductase heme-binding subunit YedZ [Gemmatimonadota bacterium]